jgi:uncharacterized membrane protein YdjX (TVP38/TMEM64 family)
MKFWLSVFVCALLLLGGFFLYDQRAFAFEIKDYISGSHKFSQLAYVFLLFSVGVYLPLNAIPLIPFGAAIFGPTVSLPLSIIGWVSGATTSFLISRVYGRHAVEHLVPLRKVDAIIETFPEKNRFLMLLIFRLVLPSDMASYALGLTKSLSFKQYFFATLISYSIYTILLSYLGSSIREGELKVAALFGIGAFAVFAFSWYLLHHVRN